MGCIMMRKCHLNTCSVGIATQDPVLRAKFQGQPEHVIHFFFFLAEQVRQHMAKLGFRTFDEMVGRVDRIDSAVADAHWKAKGIDLSSILFSPELPSHVGRRKTQAQDHGLAYALDHALIAQAKPALEAKKRVTGSFAIRNVHRTVGAMLGGEIARRYGAEGLPDETIHFRFTGSAGQSFGAFVPAGVTLELEGDSNDYVGQGALRRAHYRLPAEDLELPAGGEHSGGQRGAVRRDRRRGVLQRHRGRAVCGAQLRRHGGGGGRGRPRMRVHDQRRSGCAGRGRAQLRRGHERRTGVCVRRRGRLLHAPLQPGRRGPGAAGR